MTDEPAQEQPEPEPKPKVTRAKRRPPRDAGFDLSNPTGVTNDTSPETHPDLTQQPPAIGNTVAHTPRRPTTSRSIYLDRPDNTRGPGDNTHPNPTRPAGNSGLVVDLGALIRPPDPEADLVQVNVQLPRYMAQALDLMGVLKVGGTQQKREHARRAFGAYIPDEILDEAHRILYPHLQRPQDPPTQP